MAECTVERDLERLTGRIGARQCDDIADVAFGEEQLGYGRKRLGHVLADQPDRFAFHASHTLGLGAPEQLALGDRSLLLQAARGLERLAGNRSIRHEEHRGECDVDLGRHLV